MKISFCRLALVLSAMASPALAVDVVGVPTPEPATMVMFATGVGALFVVHKLRKKSK